MLNYKFHPIFNQDGTRSVFRMVCLLIVALCLIAWAIVIIINEEKAMALYEQEQQLLLNNRNLLFKELAENYDFVSACGDINQSFRSCNTQFSDKFKQIYRSTLEASKDGFKIVVQARESSKDKLCYKVMLDRQKYLAVFSSQGSDVTVQCVPSNFTLGHKGLKQ